MTSTLAAAAGGEVLLAESSMLRVSPRLLLALALAVVVTVGVAWVIKVPFRYNVRNVAVRWKTTLMTSLAFALVIGLLTVMLAFVNGMERLTENSGRPDNVVLLSEGSTDESFSNLGFSDIGDVENQPGIARADHTPLCSRELYVVVSQGLQTPEGEQKRRFLQLRGVDDPQVSGQVHAIRLTSGHWFSEAGVRALPGEAAPAVEAVLGAGIAGQLGRELPRSQAGGAARPLAVGETFSLAGRTFLVAGVMDSSGMTFDSEIWAKRSIVGPMFGKDGYSSLVVRAEDATKAKQLESFFDNEFEKAALNAQVETEYFASLGSTNTQFLVAIVFLTIVMAVGGVFGAMNTMYAAVAQRSKDIGVLRLLGFSRLQILCSFLIESIAVALVGGAAGCLLGSLIHGTQASSIVAGSRGGGKSIVLQMTVDANTIAVGLLLAIAVGILGGLLPALSAIRLRPLEALR